MVGTELLFVLILFVVRATPDCTTSRNSSEIVCAGHSFNSFNNIGGDARTMHINNPPKATFVVNKSKNRYLYMITTLDLTSTEVLVITEYGFKDFVSLSELTMKNCSIEALKDTWFLVNNRITKIDCSYNKLRTMSKSDLKNLKKLTIADFSHNLLESIELHAFSEMKELQELRLDGNKLKSIPTGSFPMLQKIYLSQNMIDIVPENIFIEMPKLRDIRLNNNAIRKVEDGAFKDLNYLTILLLSNNYIEEITEFTFTGFSKNAVLLVDLASNKIHHIAPGAFKEMAVIEYLDFSYNSINELNENIFEGLNARTVMLDFNEIELIGNNTFRGFKRLQKLFLDYNKLHGFTAEIFGTNLPNLEEFSVRDNSISQLDSEVFKFTPNILELELAANKLQFLPENIFIPLTKLETLHMQDNLIEELTENHIESLKSLIFLHVDHNKLTFLPLKRGSFPNLKLMDIRGNPWQCACLDEIQNFLTENDIGFFTKNYFDGHCPVCVPTYFEHCEKNTDFVRHEKIPEIYKDTNTEQCRIKTIYKLRHSPLSSVL